MKKLLIPLLILSACLLLTACSFTTANIQNAHMTTALDDKGGPADSVDSYKTDAEEFLISAELHNAPDHTAVRFVWRYLPEDVKITEMPLDSGELTDRYISCNLTNDGPWPEGAYAVEIYLEDQTKPVETVNFTVKA